MVTTIREYGNFYLRPLLGNDNGEKEQARIILQSILSAKTERDLACDLWDAFIHHRDWLWEDFIQVICGMLPAEKKREIKQKLRSSPRDEAHLLLEMLKKANRETMESLWEMVAVDPRMIESILGDITGAIGKTYPTERELHPEEA